MKVKSSPIRRVAVVLVVVLSFSLLTALPAAASEPIIRSGYLSDANIKAQLKYRNLVNPAGLNGYEGILGIPIPTSPYYSPQVQNDFYRGVACDGSTPYGRWNSTNHVEFTYAPTTGLLKSKVEANPSYCMEIILNLGSLNYLQLDVVNRATGTTVNFNNVTLNGQAVGDFTGISACSWYVTGFDFTSGFTIKGDLTLAWPTTPQTSGQETNKLVLSVGAVPTYTATASVSGGHGSVSPANQTVNYNDPATISITPDTGYHIADVLVDSSSVGAVASYTFSNVTANHTIAASFAINTYTVNASADANGSITPSGAMTVDYGAGQAFRIAPNTGYHIADVLVDGSSVGAVANYTFSNVIANHTIYGKFAIDDLTAPATTIEKTLGPDANGWNMESVQIVFTASDAGGSGVKEIHYKVNGTDTAVLGASASLQVTAEGTTVVTYWAVDNAGNKEADQTTTVKLDRTGPKTAAAQDQSANTNGWNNTDVTVALTATDDANGSGVKDIHYKSGNDAEVTVSAATAQFTVSTEGTTAITYFATDKAGNIEEPKSITVKIDKTAPVAYSRFDQVTNKVVVYAEDSVSGVLATGITVTVKPDKWSRNDDDEDEDEHDRGRQSFNAEIRTYLITDQAGNTLDFVLKVKTEGHESKAVITSIKANGVAVTQVYNIQSFMWNDDKTGNTRVLKQRMHVGKGKQHDSVQAEYNAKKNVTTIRESDPRPPKKVDKPGLVLLKMYISANGLDIR